MPDASSPVESTAYPHLFSRFDKGRLKMKNRTVAAAMSTRYASNGLITDKLIGYHANRAKGGFAMTVTEPMATLKRQNTPYKVIVQAAENKDLLKKWADAVEGHDTRLLGQIQDPGRGRHEAGRNMGAIGASPVPDDISWTVPHALTTSEVEEMIAEFALSSRILAEAGWSGIEISSGHGHIFHQFLSAWSNKREDKYGGDLAGRARLLTELIAAIRAETSDKFLIGVKLPGIDGIPGSIDLDEAERITAHVSQTAGKDIDYMTWCWGTHGDTLFWHLPDLHGPRTPFMDDITRLAKSAGDIPTGALGLITDPNEGEKYLREGQHDLVILGRPSITDPAWPLKAEQGREPSIRYCVSCNTCWHIIIAGGQVQCDNNPRVGAPDEADWKPSPAPKKKKVVIVGSGIAGMEAAWVAAGRGHDVTVLGAGPEPGGKTRLHAFLPGAENLSSIYDYQRLSAERYGARLEFGIHATLDDIKSLQPDAVVLATGSRLTWPRFLPEEYKGEGIFPDIREMTQMMLDHPGRQEGIAVIYDKDGTAMTYNAADFLSHRFERVMLITSRERIGGDEPLVNRQEIYARLFKKKNIDIVTSSEPLATSAFEDAALTYANVFNGEEKTVEGVALLTFATPRVPNDELAAPLRALGVELHLVGDAYAPRFVVTATAEGHRVGNLI